MDHIDEEACQERGIALAKVASYGENSVAEHTFALMLAVARNLAQSVQATPARKFDFEALRGFTLQGKTLGVIGAGRVGLHVISMARGFGMKVVAYERDPHAFMDRLLDFEYVDLKELRSRADIITLHAVLSESTYHMIDQEFLEGCKKGVVLINTARGGLIDTDALIEALENGQVGGAGLDVLEDEPAKDEDVSGRISEQIVANLRSVGSTEELRSQRTDRVKELADLMRNKRLLSNPKVTFTPHVAFNTEEAIQRINQSTLDNIRRLTADATSES